jgi:biopolymer transport protein ExbD
MAGGGGEGGEFDVNINLTALLDVLTNLLFFLMFSFAAQQVNMELEGGITLPTSTSDLAPKKAIQVMIGPHDLRVENNTILPVASGTLPGTGNVNARIEPLYQRLVSLREQRVAATREAPDVLFVLCDKETPYALLRRVLKTGAEAGFPKFRMAVLRE